MSADAQQPGSDEERIRAAIAGDAAALAALLRLHGPQVRGQLSIDSRWQSVLDIDDVLQVTYMEAFLKIQGFTPGGPGAFSGWLRRIAENNLRDAIRALEAQKRPPPAVSAVPRGAGDSVVALFDLLGASSATPSRSASYREMTVALEEALQRMPNDYAVVIRKYDLDGLPIADVAALLGRSPGAIHMLRARAHDHLKGLLGSGSGFFSHSP